MLRFAPSPTGDMHIGNLRAAILNFIIAKQKGEKFLIRIEDTDNARNIAGADKEILSILNLFGLFWDKLVYQSDNFKIHRDLANRLISEKKAFYCYATKDFLDKKRKEAIAQNRAFRYDDSWAEVCKSENPKPTIRLKTEFSAENIAFFDEIKGECKFSQNEIDSFVIVREDGVPTYNFACSVDDMIYDISFIVRGEDHTSNTPKQILVRKALGCDKKIKYAHLPIILNESGKKMSKRESESSVKWLLEQGFLPRAILNYLLLMGNNPPCEIFTLDEAISWFDLSGLSKSPVRFDINLLRHINREHLRRLCDREMGLLLESSAILREVILQDSRESLESNSQDSRENLGDSRESNLRKSQDSSESRREGLGKIGKIFLEESSTLNEIRAKVEAIFAPKVLSDDFRVYGAEIAILKSTILDLLEQNDESLQDFNALKAILGESCKVDDKPLKGRGLFMPLRFLLTGAGHGPHLDILYPHLRVYLKNILKFEGD